MIKTMIRLMLKRGSQKSFRGVKGRKEAVIKRVLKEGSLEAYFVR